MGRVTTQSRSPKRYGDRVYRTSAQSSIRRSSVPVHEIQQTTTSYRSGSRYDHDVVGESTAFTGNRTNVGDTGHEFDTIKTTDFISHESYRLSSLSGGAFFEGPLRIEMSGVPLPLAVPPWETSSSDVIGSEFIRSTRPTAPSANLATAIGELWADKKVASFIGSATLSDKLNVFQKAGSEYLNVVFGWVPFVGELTDVLNAVGSSEKIISQFVRDSGRIVRRKRSIDEERTYGYFNETSNGSLALPSTQLYQALEPDYENRRGFRVIRSWTGVSYSFSAAYTYYLETGGDFFTDLKRFEQLANKLLGTRITPEVLWELVPFSWLIDWMWSTGTFVSNYSAFNGDELVLKYGYVTRHSSSWRQATLEGCSYGGKSLPTITNTYSIIRKTRRRSTPYGFGRNPDSFTGAQWAILAALGMTKAPNKLLR